MSEITLEAIKSEQARLAEMIAAFEAKGSTTLVMFPATEIELQQGEHYAGIILGNDDTPSHHLILMPGEVEEVTWKGASEWAAEIGGELPTCREQSLLFANLREQFQSAWYWSCETHASGSDCAWYQYFYNGYQYTSHKAIKLRARAVRRLIIPS
jgi:hypothetical protein